MTLPLLGQNSSTFQQPVAVNADGTAPDANAILDVQSTDKGALFPRMTTAQRSTLGTFNPTEGMLVFDTDFGAFFYFMNGGWVQLATEGSDSSVPVGTILIYTDTIPEVDTVYQPPGAPGFLYCNGAEITGLVYPTLKTLLGTSWGNGGDTDPNTVNLPDLRGMIVRGVNGARSDGKQDPGDGRTSMLPGGNTGNKRGSYQSHALEQHTHAYTRRSTTYTADSGGTNVWRSDASHDTSGVNGAQVSSETRPKNAYVHYIIKY